MTASKIRSNQSSLNGYGKDDIWSPTAPALIASFHLGQVIGPVLSPLENGESLIPVIAPRVRMVHRAAALFKKHIRLSSLQVNALHVGSAFTPMDALVKRKTSYSLVVVTGEFACGTNTKLL